MVAFQTTKEINWINKKEINCNKIFNGVVPFLGFTALLAFEISPAAYLLK